MQREEKEEDKAKKSKTARNIAGGAFKILEAKRMEDIRSATELANIRDPFREGDRRYSIKERPKSTWKSFFKDRYMTPAEERVELRGLSEAGKRAKATRDAGIQADLDKTLSGIENKRSMIDKTGPTMDEAQFAIEETRLDKIYQDTYSKKFEEISGIKPEKWDVYSSSKEQAEAVKTAQENLEINKPWRTTNIPENFGKTTPAFGKNTYPGLSLDVDTSPLTPPPLPKGDPELLQTPANIMQQATAGISGSGSSYNTGDSRILSGSTDITPFVGTAKESMSKQTQMENLSKSIEENLPSQTPAPVITPDTNTINATTEIATKDISSLPFPEATTSPAKLPSFSENFMSEAKFNTVPNIDPTAGTELAGATEASSLMETGGKVASTAGTAMQAYKVGKTLLDEDLSVEQKGIRTATAAADMAANKAIMSGNPYAMAAAGIYKVADYLGVPGKLEDFFT